MNSTTPSGQTITSVSGNLITGNSYSFKVSSINIYGEGPISTDTTVLLATSPSQMNPLVISDSGTNVKIQWTPLSSGNGSPVTNYVIAIYNYATSSFDSTTGPYCDGSDSTNIANSYCLVSMASFFSAYGYQVSTSIQAIVQA